ncbi:hypothetical protein GW17_00036654 [Ensete ventricosum]|nr:hypothetical protein GW17_00036654 [Ensete ventricosum]
MPDAEGRKRSRDHLNETGYLRNKQAEERKGSVTWISTREAETEIERARDRSIDRSVGRKYPPASPLSCSELGDGGSERNCRVTIYWLTALARATQASIVRRRPEAHLPQTHTLATESDSLAPAAGAGVDPGKVVAHEPGAAKTGRSPWRKTASTVDSEKPDDPVIDAESWPTLGDARTRGSPDCADKVAPAAVPPPMAMGNAGPAPWNVPPPPPPPLVQVSLLTLFIV